MKKMIVLLSLAVSVVVLVSCASKGTVDQTTVPTQTAPAHHHHDYKGEMK